MGNEDPFSIDQYIMAREERDRATKKAGGSKDAQSLPEPLIYPPESFIGPEQPIKLDSDPKKWPEKIQLAAKHFETKLLELEPYILSKFSTWQKLQSYFGIKPWLLFKFIELRTRWLEKNEKGKPKTYKLKETFGPVFATKPGLQREEFLQTAEQRRLILASFLEGEPGLSQNALWLAVQEEYIKLGAGKSQFIDDLKALVKSGKAVRQAKSLVKFTGKGAHFLYSKAKPVET